MTVVVKVGGAVAAASAEAVLALAARDEVCVVHGAGPADLGGDGARRDPRRVRRRPARHDRRGDRDRPRLARGGQRRRSAPRSASAPSALFGDEIGLEADPVPALGLVGEARTSSLPAVTEALAAGKIPVVAPIAQGPLNVNADSAAAAIAAGSAPTKLLFLTDVDGLILDGAVVDAIDLDSAEELMASGTLEGGIIPKLGAAIASARGGVPPTRPHEVPRMSLSHVPSRCGRSSLPLHNLAPDMSLGRRCRLSAAPASERTFGVVLAPDTPRRAVGGT